MICGPRLRLRTLSQLTFESAPELHIATTQTFPCLGWLYVLRGIRPDGYQAILIRSALKLAGTAGHGSLAFCPRNEQNTSLRRSNLHEKCAGTFLPEHRQNNCRQSLQYFISVLRGRFELPTPGSSDQCSNQLSYLSERVRNGSLLTFILRATLRQALLT